MKTVLVTGGAGFIGSHLCDRLLDDGNTVICLDNFFTGQKKNVVHLLDNPYFELVRHDVTQPYFAEVDEIYNLACPASPVHYQYNPIKTSKTSVMGAINMLGLAKRVKGKMLQASTSEVYGDPKIHPQVESYWGNVNPIGLRSCYDEGKRCAETLCMDYHRQNRVRVKIVRIFNTYGPRMFLRDGRVVSNFIVQALQNEAVIFQVFLVKRFHVTNHYIEPRYLWQSLHYQLVVVEEVVLPRAPHVCRPFAVRIVFQQLPVVQHHYVGCPVGAGGRLYFAVLNAFYQLLVRGRKVVIRVNELYAQVFLHGIHDGCLQHGRLHQFPPFPRVAVVAERGACVVQ